MNRTSDDDSVENRRDPRFAERKANYSLEADDQPWFFRLKAGRRGNDTGLFGYYGEKNLLSGVVIARDMSGEKKDYKMFTWFPTHAAFFEWADKHAKDWHFYELIGATIQKQKPYFDLDISLQFLKGYVSPTCDPNASLVDKALHLVRLVRDEIQKKLRADFTDLTEEQTAASIYESVYQDKDGERRKFSFHIVFPELYFGDHEDMRRFGQEFKEDHPDFSEIVDDIWYSTRQFRTWRSWKLGQAPESRKKGLYLQDSTYKEEESMVTLIPGTATQLVYSTPY